MKILLHNEYKIINLWYPTYVHQFFNFLIITKIECWPVFKQDPKIGSLLSQQLLCLPLPPSLTLIAVKGEPPHFDGAPPQPPLLMVPRGPAVQGLVGAVVGAVVGADHFHGKFGGC